MSRLCHRIGIEKLVINCNHAGRWIDRRDLLNLARVLTRLFGIDLLIRKQQDIISGCEGRSIGQRDLEGGISPGSIRN